MRLFESIIDANHRAVAGDASAGLHPADYAESLPVVALTCIDPRLNAFFPNALALPSGQFVWLRNAGNIITHPLSSTMRSLALACAVKGGREIAVIGHSDCQICKTTLMTLLDKLKALGVDRGQLPENLNEFFGMFGSERQNVIKACEFIRNSPLIGPNIPVHGLLLDLETGRLESIVNGYDTLGVRAASSAGAGVAHAGNALGTSDAVKDFAMGEMKFPEMKIGEKASQIGGAIVQEAHQLDATIGQVIRPAVQFVKEEAAQFEQYAQPSPPKPPPVNVTPSLMSSVKKRVPAPPPIRPGSGDFRRR